MSSQLREALECAPPFRAFLGSHRGSGGRAGVRVAGKATPPEIPLADLIISGIPASLNAPEVGSHGWRFTFNDWCGFWSHTKFSVVVFCLYLFLLVII